MSGLDARDDELRELMDDPACDPVRLRRTLERFGLVNRLVSGWGAVYRRRIRPLAIARGEISVLDIGCGGGDVLRRLVALARRDGIAVRAVGIDPDERSLAVARRGIRHDDQGGGRGATPAIELRRAHSSDLVAEQGAGGGAFDLVISSHVLHHLTAAELPAFLADSAALSRGLVLHSDISRSRAAYAAYAIGITPLAPGSFLRTDGLRSIRRSWRPDELAARLPPGWRVERPAPFRLLATFEVSP